MIDKAPVGYLSPSHLSEGDRLLAKKFVGENETGIGIQAITLDLIIELENVSGNPDEFYEALKNLRTLGFSENFCRIMVDAYNQEFLYVLFHEYAPENPFYEKVTNQYHVFD